MSGFENDVLVLKNVNFDYTELPPHPGIVTADGQLLIGTTADADIAMVANTLTAGTGITITNAPGSITIAATSGGSTPIGSLDVQAATLPGDDPVIPTVGGVVTVNGAVVTNHAVPLETRSRALNAYNVEVQYAEESLVSTPNLSGVAHFDSAGFDVDTTGFVQLAGGGIAATKFDIQATTSPGDDPVIPNAMGVVAVNGAVVANHSVPLETRSRADNEYNVEVQYAATSGSTDGTKSGVAHFNSAQFTVDPFGFVSSTGAGATDLHTARYIVSAGSTADGANYTTIQSAITAAGAAGGKQTVFIQPKSTPYTENLTMIADVNLAAYTCDAVTGGVTILGTITCTYSGLCSIIGIKIQTNGATAISMSGANLAGLSLYNCNLIGTNADIITNSSTNVSGGVACFYCDLDVADVGFKHFALSNASSLNFQYCKLRNSGGSVTANTATGSGTFTFETSFMNQDATISGSTITLSSYSFYNSCTFNSTGVTKVNFSKFRGTAAIAITVGPGAGLQIENCIIDTTNATAISVNATGLLSYANLSFISSNIISDGTTTAARQVGRVSRPGIVLNDKQPAFLAYNSVAGVNLTGDGTTYILGTGVGLALIEVFDQNNDFVTTGTFTTPYTGRYEFSVSVRMGPISTAHTLGYISLNTSNNNYNGGLNNPFATKASNTELSLNFTVLTEMDIADTATSSFTIFNGAKTVGIGNNGRETFFCGQLAC